MDTLQCAIVLAKIERFDLEVAKRLRVGARYNLLLDEIGIKRTHQREDRTSVFAQYTVLIDRRAEVENALKYGNIPTAVHYPLPLNAQPAYQHLSKFGGRTVVAEQLSKRVMSLPMGPDLPDEHLVSVVSSLKSSLL